MFFIAESYDIIHHIFEGQTTWHLFLSTRDNISMNIRDFNPSRPDSRWREKNSLNFYFKSTLKAFIKPFESPQIRV